MSTIVTLAFPLASYASAPGPLPTHPIPADTLSKLDKAKSDRAGPASKKKLKARSTTQAPTRSEFVPDQPWETEFFVENDISGRRAIQIALASFAPRR